MKAAARLSIVIIAILAWYSKEVTCCGSMPDSSSLVKIYKVKSSKLTDNLLSTDSGSGTPIGQVVLESPPPAGNVCSYLLPVHALYSSFYKSHYYTLDNQEYNNLKTQRWEDQGVLGYAVPTVGLCNANVQIYGFYQDRGGYIQVNNETSDVYFNDRRGRFVFVGRSWAFW